MKKEKTPQYLADAENAPMATDTEEPLAPEPSAPALVSDQTAAAPQPATAPAAAPISPSPEAQTAPQSPAMPLASSEPLAPAPIPPPLSHPTAMDYSNEDLKQMHDAATRQIKPQTYASMFHDKSTMGKIGTLFGLMLSGAGSGLAHQSNAVLDMMNNVIKNDLEGQKTNVTNAQNFLTMAYNHELQQAQIRRSQYENAFTQAQIGKVPAEIAQMQAQTAYNVALAKGIPADIASKMADIAYKKAMMGTIPSQIAASKAATEASLAQTAVSKTEQEKKQIELSQLKGAFQPIAGQTPPPASTVPTQGPSDQMPSAPGPQSTLPNPEDMKQASTAAPFRAKNMMLTAAAQKLGDDTANNPQAQAVYQSQIIPAIAAEHQKNNSQMQSALDLNQSQQDAVHQDVINNRAKLDSLVTTGRQFPNLPSNVAMPPAQAEQAQKEIGILEKNRAEYKAWLDAFHKLQALKNAGQVPFASMLGSSATGAGTLVGAGAGALAGSPIVGGIIGNALGNVAEKGAAAVQDTFERERKTIIGDLQKRLGKNLDSMLPSWNDTPKTRALAFQKGVEDFQNQEEGFSPILKTYGLKNPFPAMPYDPVYDIPWGQNTLTRGPVQKTPQQKMQDELLKSGEMKMAW